MTGVSPQRSRISGTLEHGSQYLSGMFTNEPCAAAPIAAIRTAAMPRCCSASRARSESRALHLVTLSMLSYAPGRQAPAQGISTARSEWLDSEDGCWRATTNLSYFSIGLQTYEGDGRCHQKTSHYHASSPSPSLIHVPVAGKVDVFACACITALIVISISAYDVTLGTWATVCHRLHCPASHTRGVVRVNEAANRVGYREGKGADRYFSRQISRRDKRKTITENRHVIAC
ncbi:hypothetical protein F4825DRAFT_406678 [Nemania diffusa]|nr:hypothetical protein F4825DRAFT_406678 [Nemania diffusa]